MNTVAPISHRLEAALTTLVPVGLATVALLFVLGLAVPPPRHQLLATIIDAFLTTLALCLPALLLVLDGARVRATSGMRQRSLRYASCQGSEISAGRAATRILAGLLLMPLSPVSWIMILTDPQRRGLADRLCGTIVCSVPDTRQGFPVVQR